MKAFCLFVFTSNHCSDLFSHSGLMCLLGTNGRLFSVTRATALRRPRYHFVFILCLFSPLSGARTSEVPNYGELQELFLDNQQCIYFFKISSFIRYSAPISSLSFRSQILIGTHFFSCFHKPLCYVVILMFSA